MNIPWQQLCSYHFEELSLLAKLAADQSLPIYLVGGCLRDAFLNCPSADYDIASAGDPTALAKTFSRKISGHWFCLDAQRGYSRVIKSAISSDSEATIPCLQIDFAPLRAESIEGDLALRDFTINAMATMLLYPINIHENLLLIDPLEAIKDLSAECLRMCSSDVLTDDPLRIIKGLRHCAQLGFAIERNTLESFKFNSPLLRQIPGERIRNELALLFAGNHHQQAISLFIQIGGASALWLHGDEQYVISNYVALQVKIKNILEEPSLTEHMLCLAGDNFTVLSFLRFISLMRSFLLEDQIIEAILDKLHFNKRLRKLIVFACKINSAQLNHFSSLACSQRGKMLWLQQIGAPLPTSLLVCAVLAEVKIDIFALTLLYRNSFKLLNNNKIAPLLTNKQVIQYRPELVGRKVGGFFSDLAQQEILGHVNSEHDAIVYLKRWYESN